MYFILPAGVISAPKDLMMQLAVGYQKDDREQKPYIVLHFGKDFGYNIAQLRKEDVSSAFSHRLNNAFKEACKQALKNNRGFVDIQELAATQLKYLEKYPQKPKILI